MVGWITPYPYKHISRRNSCRLFPNIQITVPQAAAMIRSPPGLVVPLLTLAAVKRKNFYCIICIEKKLQRLKKYDKKSYLQPKKHLSKI